MRMRVLTWNIHGLRDAGIAEIAGAISAEHPDIVCLNEVPRSRGKSLAATAGMRAYVAASPIGPYGNVILTAGEVTSWAPLRFDDVRRVDRRDAAVVTLASGVTIAAVHLSLRAADRARHIRQLLDALPERAIVAGDMNERPGGTVWRTLDERLSDAGAGDPQPTFPAGAPTARIDGIWVPQCAVVRRCEVLATALSDHRPVVADLEL